MKIFFYVLLLITLFVTGCKRPPFDKNKYGNCSDGIKNQNEEDVDCGGYCVPCANCDNGIMDGGETGIDCGAYCLSCIPTCSLNTGTATYTVYPPGLTSSVTSNSNGGNGYYYSTQNRIDISFNNGYVSNVRIELLPGFNPTTYISLNQTMILKTSNDVTQKNKVRVRYSGSFGFNSFYNYVDAGEPVYITKISSNNFSVQICKAKAGNERISINANFN